MPPCSSSPAAERNKQPILELLLGLLPPRGQALEIASGTGQHAAWFTPALPHWRWQTSECEAQSLPLLAQRLEQDCAGAGLPVLPPVRIDVRDPQWPSDGAAFTHRFDLVYCANMLHIAPWACCRGLMQGCARTLQAGGLLVLYGPFLEDGVVTAEGNLAFDRDLRSRNPDWGLRRLQAVQQEAGQVGLRLQARHAMPANNLLLVFARVPP